MNGSSSSLPPTFPFPFTPYDIQSDFMKHLYTTLEEGKIGIFESPTGTGKSLSLICGAVTWLKDYERKKRIQLEEQVAKENELQDDESDWFASFAKKKEQMEKIREAKSEIEYLKKQEKRFSELKLQMKRKRNSQEADVNELSRNSKYAKDDHSDDSAELKKHDDDGEILLGDYASDDENREENTDIEEEKNITKIYYCSRTHSQLSQFVREIQRSPYANNIRVVSLGSRQNMCINETVQKLKNLSLMNEKCLDMQKGKKLTKTTSNEAKNLRDTASKNQSLKACPFHKQSLMEEMRDHIFVEVKDIEQIVEMGRQRKACPYYSTRYGVNEAELVVMPYNMLLHKSTRNACGITLKGNVVIIDEAHNLLETINNIHSSMVTGEQLINAHSQLDQYLNKFRSRLNPKNLMYVKQILFLLSAFIKHLGGNVDITPTDELTGEVQTCIYSYNDFLSLTEIDNINLFKILKYCEKSQISHKLHGFAGTHQVAIHKKDETSTYMQSSILDFLSKILNKDDDATSASAVSEEQSTGSPFVFFQEFLRALTNPSSDGRILSQKQETLRKSLLKFILLNPAVQFEEIVSECKSIIVAGGTMQPTSDFIDQLFIPSGAKIDRITHFSCGHVIPPENLLGIALSHGPSGKPLDFTFQCRDTTEVMDELGRTLINVCTIVPAGVVCFFPSYEYEQKVHAHWEKTGFTYRLNGKKRVFREPRKAMLLEQVLAEYGRSASQKRVYSKQPNGAILFCVVGGKMSEGINFSDDLGRAVVMVGLPYPNVNSPELREKMNYLNKIVPKVSDGKLSGQVYYENICMKAVNQSIGRAVRHKEDHAIILLLDGRYLRPSVTSALPTWISTRLTSYPKFNHAFAAVRQFFADKKKNTVQETTCT